MSIPLKIDDFMGMMPKRDKRLLPGNLAQTAANCKLWTGALDPLHAPLPVFTPTKRGSIESFYRIDDREGGSDFWMHWPQDVDVIRGPVVDARQRFYYTGNYEPRVCTYEMAVLGTDTVKGANNYPASFGEDVATYYPRAFYALGVPNPYERFAIASITGGAAADVTRAYVLTFVTAWGEESGPSPALLRTGKPDGTWNISAIPAKPTQTGNIIAASFVSGVATIYCSDVHWARKGHRIIFASVTGMVELNGAQTLSDALCLKVWTTNRERTTNVAKLYLESVAGFEVGQTVAVTNMGDASFNGNAAITAVDIDNKTISFSNAGANVAKTADTGGRVIMAQMKVDLASATAYVSGGTWTREAPWNVTGMTKRIYRTLTGTAETKYQLVAEIAGASTSYGDAVADLDLGPVLATQGYDLPPGNLISLCEMSNGISVGGADNEVCFSEQFVPYAWKVANRQPLAWPIVGVATYGQVAVACTKGAPQRLGGMTPDTISMDDPQAVFPCVSKRGICSLGWGVVYPSDQGLVVVSQQGTELLTQAYYSRDEWQALANGGVFSSCMMYDNRYYAFWTTDDSTGACLTFSPKDPKAVLTQNTQLVSGAWMDPETGIAYVMDLATGQIGKWDAHPAITLTAEWLSKQFDLRAPQNFGAGYIDADFSVTAAESAAIDAENADIEADNQALIATISASAPPPPLRAFIRGPDASKAAFGTQYVEVREASTTRARNANVATIGVADASKFNVGQEVIVHRLGGTGFNGRQTITGVDVFTNTITYDNTGANVGSTADTGGFVDRRVPKFTAGGATILQPLIPSAAQFAQIQIFSRGDLKATRTLNKAGYFRLPTGYRIDSGDLRILTNIKVRCIRLGETMIQLKRA